ncbi:MAG: hypothetical protein N2Z23_06600 [Pyrinomonadaceae bacterium]|nr:hypothetical protein [Pyrinomonadaceae bacterium]MCX7640092.1 hypothetical protein [Pyrinomonadaceae bacterium]MDW8304264.1 hypothetical protein [Acidobacteriota bacterium]
MRKVAGIFIVLMLVSLFVACPTRTNIGDIVSNPSRFQDKEVAVAGTVENSFGVAVPIFRGSGGGIYKLDDGTGEIWVVTNKGVPSRGTKVGVKGKIQNGITINGKNYGLALIEEDRKFKRD